MRARARSRPPASASLTLVLGALAIAAGAGDAGMGIMVAGQRAALGNFLAFTRTQEATADAGRRAISLEGAGSAARACSISSASCRTRNIASRSIPRTASTATHPLSSERIQALAADLPERSRLGQAGRPGARSALPAGQGQAARLRRSQAGGDQISGERPERPGALCARLRLSPRRLPGQSGGGGQRAARDRPARPLLPRAQGPDPARRRQAEGSDPAASRGDAALGRGAADRRDARPRAGRDRRCRRISPRPSRSSRPP